MKAFLNAAEVAKFLKTDRARRGSVSRMLREALDHYLAEKEADPKTK